MGLWVFIIRFFPLGCILKFSIIKCWTKSKHLTSITNCSRRYHLKACHLLPVVPVHSLQTLLWQKLAFLDAWSCKRRLSQLYLSLYSWVKNVWFRFISISPLFMSKLTHFLQFVSIPSFSETKERLTKIGKWALFSFRKSHSSGKQRNLASGSLGHCTNMSLI